MAAFYTRDAGPGADSKADWACNEVAWPRRAGGTTERMERRVAPGNNKGPHSRAGEST